jgi:hypothetical protein
MSKALTLKLRDEIFSETEEILKKSKHPRNAYINEAVNLYNKLWRRSLLKKTLLEESLLVSADSMEVLNAFEKFEENLPE